MLQGLLQNCLIILQKREQIMKYSILDFKADQ